MRLGEGLRSGRAYRFERVITKVSEQQAIIKTGGKQYRVETGTVLRVEKLDAEVGASIEIPEVLLVGRGGEVKIGTPLLSGAKVSAEVCAHGRGKKLIGMKFRRRKNYKKKWGHRQDYTELKITGITA